MLKKVLTAPPRADKIMRLNDSPVLLLHKESLTDAQIAAFVDDEKPLWKTSDISPHSTTVLQLLQNTFKDALNAEEWLANDSLVLYDFF